MTKTLTTLPRDIKSVTHDDLDRLIDKALRDRHKEVLAVALPERLRRLGEVSSMALICHARDLYLVYSTRAWAVGNTYPSFRTWVLGEYEEQPWGRSYKTVMSLIGIWRFWALEQGWDERRMALVGKAKLERAKATASRQVESRGHIDPLLVDVLDDNDVSHGALFDEYRGRKFVTDGKQPEHAPDLPPEPDPPPPGTQLFDVYDDDEGPYYRADTDTGELSAWVYVAARRPGRPPNRVAVKLGDLKFDDIDAAPHLAELMKRAKVHVV